MNECYFMGRLTKDPEVRYTQSGKVVATFCLAVDRTFTDGNGNKETDFFNMVVWGKLAELIGNTVGKGQRLLCRSRAQVRQYTDNKAGAAKWITEYIVQGFEYVEKRGDKQNGDGAVPAEPAGTVQTDSPMAEMADAGQARPDDGTIPLF